MKHPSTSVLYAYWNEKRGNRLAPERADIDPAAIRHALGDTFMLAADFVDVLRFRLAGTRVCALFCHEIKGETFAELWTEASRDKIDALMRIVDSETLGAVAGVTGRTADGSEVDLEMLLLPLAHVGHARIRTVGVLAPAEPPYWLGEKPVVELDIGTLRHIGSELETIGAPHFPARAPQSRRKHNFTVYSGGLETPPPGKRAG